MYHTSAIKWKKRMSSTRDVCMCRDMQIVATVIDLNRLDQDYFNATCMYET